MVPAGVRAKSDAASDGAHPGTMPDVPCAHAMTGRGPSGSAALASTTPLATAVLPSSRVVA
ncbi:hypothetical protein K1W54_42000 [Micromonospora sp. CPCC 205371]|nr:hypothetical protein [Micromonospora sp. CPCC 205371]